MNQVEDLCDRVALIHKGSLMVYGEVNEVRRRYSLPEVRVSLEGGLPDLPEVQSAQHEGDSTWRLRLRDGTTPADVLAALVRAGAGVERFEKASHRWRTFSYVSWRGEGMRQWRKVHAVGLFEFQCTVRSKSWLIATFGMPFFLMLYAGVVSIPAILEISKEKQVTVYGVVDKPGVLGLKDDVAMPGPDIPEEIRSAIHAAGQQEILKQRMLWVQNIVFRHCPPRRMRMLL